MVTEMIVYCAKYTEFCPRVIAHIGGAVILLC